MNVFRKSSALFLLGCFVVIGVLATSLTTRSSNLTPEKARLIAEEAYIYAYPMMQNYKTLYYRSVVDAKPFNQFSHRHALLDPSFRNIVGPNNDTLYSAVWLDLRAEPLVVSVPAVPKERYYSLQFIDMFTHNFAYIGQRETGSQAGTYLIVGPDHVVESVPGVNKIYRSESNFVFVIGRILAKDHDDQQQAAGLQRKYSLQPLSQFLASGDKESVPAIDFPAYDPEKIKTAEFIELLNFLLTFVDIHPDEKSLFKRFSQIGITAGQPSGFDQRSSNIQQAISAGVSDAYQKISDESKVIGSQVAGWNTTYHGFGPRSVMQGKYLLRAAAAMIALYGNDRQENSSFSRQVDQQRIPLHGAESGYTLRFEKGQLPPANAFWSLTMYRLPEVLLYENAIHRYSIGDRTQSLHYAEDGSLTFYLQHKPPIGKAAANWLPSPAGPFAVALRLYLPHRSVHNGQWQPPELVRVDNQ